METKKIIAYVTIGLVALIGVIAMFSAIYVVDAGHCGVKKTLGNVEQKTYESGIGLKAPFFTTVIEFDTRTQKMESKTACYTSDMQTAELDYNLTYNLKNDNIHILYSKVGTDYEAKKVVPLLNDVLKDVIGKWQAQELVANRDSARVQVTSALQKKLDARFFENVSFQFNNIDYSDNFEQAIEAKVIAEQKAQEAVNKTKQIEEEAKQKVIAAEAEAKSMQIKADALSKNKSLIEYEMAKKWDGKMPTTVIGGGSNNLLQLPLGK